jgi:acyl-CoA reductase-like NAD-dependent aldehyde dehydrogenase
MTITPTSQNAIDEALGVLQANKDAWVTLSIDERIAILDEIKHDMIEVADRWIAASINAKGIPALSNGEGEEWSYLAGVFHYVRLLRHSLIDIQKYGRPQIPGPIITRSDGQVMAQVFPQTKFDSILFRGFTGEVWMGHGVTPEETISTQSLIYRDKNHKGKVVSLLGAGNVSVLTPVDFLYKLFIEDQVVALKTNPVNAYLGPLMEEGFRALVQRGFLRVVYGGVAEGLYLCYHPAVDEIHLLGSDKTFDAIVFDPGAEGARRKAEQKPLITKRFTAELGNVTPVIIVPGPWNDDDIREQAVQITSWLAANAGFQCHTPRVIIQHKNWKQRAALIKAIGDALSETETRKAYYPGAKEIHAAFLAAHTDALTFGEARDDHLPWTLIADIDPKNIDDICFKTEAFCSLFAETAIEAQSVSDFIDRAVEFANKTLWGTLCAAIIVHPKSHDDPQVAVALKHAIANLRYGMICVNLRAELGYAIMQGTWGGFPGHNIYDVQSGIGLTHNALMFDRPQKTVVRGPFTKSPNPYVVTSKRMCEFLKKLAYFEASPSLWKLLGLLWTALRS